MCKLRLYNIYYIKYKSYIFGAKNFNLDESVEILVQIKNKPDLKNSRNE